MQLQNMCEEKDLLKTKSNITGSSFLQKLFLWLHFCFQLQKAQRISRVALENMFPINYLYILTNVSKINLGRRGS